MKLKIFVSSTINDLPSEREAAYRGILDVPAIPIMSERTFNAMDKNSLDACLTKVIESDIFLLILGAKYGYEYKNKSITELEYEKAKQLKLPILVFNLPYVDKQDKQKEFVQKVGDINDGRFWIEPKNVFELKDKITDALREVIKQNELSSKQSTEFLYPNLIPITFPDKLYIAEKSIDRNDIIEKSWETEFKLKKRCSDRQLIVRATLFNSRFCPDGWYSFENKIITFRNLRDPKEPLYTVIDNGTVDEIECSAFFMVSDSYKNYFKALVAKTFIEFLKSRKIYKVKEKKTDIYRFGMLDLSSPSTRTIKWQKVNMAKRKVIHKRISKEDGHVICYRHLAFTFSIQEINDKWFICLNPTWSYTSDGIKKSNFQRQYLAGIKEKENSQAVYNQFIFIHYYLYNSDLFNPESNYLRFNRLQKIEFEPAIQEEKFKIR